MQNLTSLQNELTKAGNKSKAKFLARYFKTGIGEYGAGDIFIGITVPTQRAIAKKYLELSLADIAILLKSKIHEFRLTALMILVDIYKKANDKEKQMIYKFYLSQDKGINNWDLVDLSALYIVGDYLFNYERSKALAVLINLTKSKNIWQRRIAVLATFYFIKHEELQTPLKIAALLINDKHDLIHKAVGWMLRELGKRSLLTEEKFLKQWQGKMPRTMLRYAIERFPEKKRLKILKHY